MVWESQTQTFSLRGTPNHDKVKLPSHVQLFVTPWTVAHGIFQARVLEWVVISFSNHDKHWVNNVHPWASVSPAT